MGRRHLALQCGILCPARLHQICCTLHIEWKSLGHPDRKKGKFCHLVIWILELCILFFSPSCGILIIKCRLLSVIRRIMVERKGKHNGLSHKEHCMDYILQKPAPSSLTKAATGSFQRLLSRPRGVLRLQGMQVPFNLSNTMPLFDFSISSLVHLREIIVSL